MNLLIGGRSEKQFQEKFRKKLEGLDQMLLSKAGITQEALKRALEFLGKAKESERTSFKSLLDSAEAMVNPDISAQERKKKAEKPFVGEGFDSDIMMIWMMINPIPTLNLLEEKRGAIVELRKILGI